MCVILNLTKKELSKKELLQAWYTNPDGASIWATGMPQPLKFERFFNFSKFINSSEYAAIPDGAQVVAHFRISTGGRGVHPFKIPNTSYWLYHNGICGKSRGNKSDTQLLAESLRGLNEAQIVEYLQIVNDRGGGKFLLLDPTTGKIKEIGFTKRSNENHLPHQYQPNFLNHKKTNLYGEGNRLY